MYVIIKFILKNTSITKLPAILLPQCSALFSSASGPLSTSYSKIFEKSLQILILVKIEVSTAYF